MKSLYAQNAGGVSSLDFTSHSPSADSSATTSIPLVSVPLEPKNVNITVPIDTQSSSGVVSLSVPVPVTDINVDGPSAPVAVYIGDSATAASSVDNTDGSVPVGGINKSDNGVGLNTELSGGILSRGSDVDMLDALRENSRPEAVFAFPPVSRLTLNFISPELETAYRRSGLARPRPSNNAAAAGGSGRDGGGAIGCSVVKLTWATSRITPLINLTTNSVFFLCIFACCLTAYPSIRTTGSVVFFLLSSLGFFSLLALFTVILADMSFWIGTTSAAHLCHRRERRQNIEKAKTSSPIVSTFQRRAVAAYRALFRWRTRNLIGALVLFLPSSLVLASFRPCLFQSQVWANETALDLASIMVKNKSVLSSSIYLTNDHLLPTLSVVAGYRTITGLFCCFMLFNFTLFTMYSSWTKSLSASFTGLLGIILLHWPIQPPHACSEALESAEWAGRLFRLQYNDHLSSQLPAWVMPAALNEITWELSVILVLSLALVWALNREFDVSFRVSFNRDSEARCARLAISREKIQAEWLLENIIPVYIMDSLRLTNKYSQHIDDAGVVFATISNFSEFYDEQYQGGQEMLRVLNEIFADFEHQLVASPRYKGVEKIKTIGACFMAASGLNLAERAHNRRPGTHLCALMDFAMNLITTLEEFNRQMFSFKFELKVGYNIGEVTAGVIGTTKLLYDIWGDTVNVASRMYSTGQKGRIQVTQAVAERLQPWYAFEYRGEVFVKGKGNMKTYLLVGKRPHQSSNALTSLAGSTDTSTGR
ncbi:unnamed protein product [Protopolystoma xenopodis]|uniref:adenylate cyclase n=1 Tax=Protopolystoma xenopodis TaxID=117903 RepID=A0A3S5CUG7_9PLAT|nr:unnamed protein product [Protopolystoma xenopodis]